MTYIAIAIFTLQLVLLASAGWVDVASRLIPNEVCIAIALLGAISRLLISPLQLAESLAITLGVFMFLMLLWVRRMLGGGDVKLLTAISLGLPFVGIVRLIAITGLAGGVLAFAYLAMRYLPRPKLPTTRSIFRRVYAAERWRIMRHGPLPYGVAIACGGIWAAFINTGI